MWGYMKKTRTLAEFVRDYSDENPCWGNRGIEIGAKIAAAEIRRRLRALAKREYSLSPHDSKFFEQIINCTK